MKRAALAIFLSLFAAANPFAEEIDGAAFFKTARESMKFSRNGAQINIKRASVVPAKGLCVSVPDGEMLSIAFSNKTSMLAVGPAEFKIEAFIQGSAENSPDDNPDRESAPSNISLSLKNGRFLFSLAQRLGSSKFTVKFPNAESEIQSGIAIAETGTNGSRLIPLDGFARIKPQDSIWEIVKDGVSAVVPAKESDKKIIFKHVYSRERERFGNFIKTAEQLRRSVIFKYSPNAGFAAELILPKAFFAMPIKH